MCSDAMRRYEPAMLDLHGAQWTSLTEYKMYPGAVRYEQYEKSFAAQVISRLHSQLSSFGITSAGPDPRLPFGPQRLPSSFSACEAQNWRIGKMVSDLVLDLQVGFGVAVEAAVDVGLDWTWDRIQHLSSRLRSKLKQLPGVHLHDTGKTLSGLVTFTLASTFQIFP